MITSFKDLLFYLRSDAFRYIGKRTSFSILKLYCSKISYRYIVWMRVNAFLHGTKLKVLRLFLFWTHFRLRRISYKTGIQIPWNTQVGAGFYIGHFGTIVINSSAQIGKNVNVSPGVNIGESNRGSRKGVPRIGDVVYIGPGAKIVGAVNIGSNVAIGANAVVTHDVPNNSVVAGVPARVLSMDGAEGYINRII